MLAAWAAFLSLRTRFGDWARRAMGDETGATVAEYALVLVLVSLAVMLALGNLGNALTAKIEGIITRLGQP